MIDNSLKSVLDDEKISNALIKNSVEKLCNNSRLYIFSDHCDIRKPHASKQENQGKVRTLDGKIVNGYTTLNSVILDERKKNLTLSNISVFSNKDDDFICKKELEDYHKDNIKNPIRKAEIAEKIEDESLINMGVILKKHLKKQSEAFKQASPDISLCHVHDRAADSIEYLEFIKDELGDDAVVRVKKSRNSNQAKINPDTGRKVHIKLINSTFANQKVYLINKPTLKGKCYQNAKCLIEWDKINLNGHDYTTIRATLYKRDGSKLYKEPMLLMTTIEVNSYLEAQEIYRIYLLRSKIESVFKFLKEVLGWEEFQVRDWESIKNIIAICFFVGGYFYEIDSELTKNATIIMICDLGGGKGKVTRHFFLQGLKKLLIAESVNKFREQHHISDELYSEMQAYAGISE
ncbi:transposase [Candidatus Venteria ishoeyi]|uniref:Transposase DDE domain protein n=2 Tax=Candidatus Venteria ishoeyi TaxID=1899563 RepID=A0A1H6F923_9GAMM|nr:transposase [Candidatus Venteria ishoeyi]SEH06622.1 Transposase DDE domain protein [Candidatus Venteria ishoeyi]